MTTCPGWLNSSTVRVNGLRRCDVGILGEKTGIAEIFTIDRRDFEAYRMRGGRRFRLVLA
jgi:hypothetical protein